MHKHYCITEYMIVHGLEIEWQREIETKKDREAMRTSD